MIDLIARLPNPEEIYRIASGYAEAEEWEKYEAYAQEIADLAWPAYNAYMALTPEQQRFVTNYDVLEQSSWLWSAVPMSVQATEDYISYSGADLNALISRTGDTLKDSNGTTATYNKDGTVTLKSIVTDVGNNISKDPYVWLDLPAAAQGYDYVVVTYIRTESLPKDADGDDVTDAKMQMFAVSTNAHTGASEENSDYTSIGCDQSYQYSVFDFSGFNGTITNIRFDYIDRFPDKENAGDTQSVHNDVLGFSMDIESIIFCKNEEVAERVAMIYGERDDDVDVVEGDGITFKLFNYSLNINKTADGSAWRPIANYFTFRNSQLTSTSAKGPADNVYTPIVEDCLGYTNGSSINRALDADGFTLRHATVERILDSHGNPVLDLTRDSKGNPILNEDGEGLA